MSEHEQSPLQRSLAELSAFLVSEQSIADSLTRISSLAVDALAPAMFAGITMMVDGRVTTRAFTDPTCPEIDHAQYESGRGPCMDAFRGGAVVVVESLRGDDRWPEFAAAATAHGVRSTLSLPMLTGGAPIGALNFYASTAGAFGESDVDVGRMFAAQASVVLVNAQAYWGARLRSEDLERALAGREVIDMAKGIIVNSMGCDPDTAFDVLVKQSQAENRKLRDVAADIVARAQRPR
ncbi:MAG: response regulator receiver and domain protein [Acidimicrobiales bacterium]|nr:response regulator receiver and domain protein [Acidimicrobiales bacterium]